MLLPFTVSFLSTLRKLPRRLASTINDSLQGTEPAGSSPSFKAPKDAINRLYVLFLAAFTLVFDLLGLGMLLPPASLMHALNAVRVRHQLFTATKRPRKLSLP